MPNRSDRGEVCEFPPFGTFVPPKMVNGKLVPDIEKEREAKRKWDAAYAKLSPECKKRLGTPPGTKKEDSGPSVTTAK